MDRMTSEMTDTQALPFLSAAEALRRKGREEGRMEGEQVGIARGRVEGEQIGVARGRAEDRAEGRAKGAVRLTVDLVRSGDLAKDRAIVRLQAMLDRKEITNDQFLDAVREVVRPT